MESKEAITTVRDYLDANVFASVRTSMQENENPRPVVVLDEWERDDKNFHNTTRRGVEVDDEGNITAAVFHHYYDLRIEFEVRTRDESRAYDTMEDVENSFLPLEENPSELHGDINKLRFRRGSGVDPHHNLERSEISLHATVEITSFKRRTRDVDVLEEVTKDIE